VTLFDVVADQLQNALAAIEKQLKMLEGDGLLREGQTASELMRSVSVSSDLKEAMEGTNYVQVAIFKYYYTVRVHQIYMGEWWAKYWCILL
jgi:3-hydroxyacyl-CoA dehydrogenase